MHLVLGLVWRASVFINSFEGTLIVTAIHSFMADSEEERLLRQRAEQLDSDQQHGGVASFLDQVYRPDSDLISSTNAGLTPRDHTAHRPFLNLDQVSVITM